MTIEFDDNLITKNELIDSQHKELIDRIKKFVDSCEEGAGKVKAIQMLDYLAEYTDFHFSAEEKLQEDARKEKSDMQQDKPDDTENESDDKN